MTCPRCKNESCTCVCQVCRVTPMRTVPGGIGNVTADGRLWCGCNLNRSDDMIDKKGQPMTQSRLGITPGEVEASLESNSSWYVRRVANLAHLARFFATAETEANAELYADAHNVANRTGLTPGELERQRDHYKHKVDVLQARIDQLNKAVQWRDVVEQDEDRDEEAASKANEDVCWAIRQCQILASITEHDKKLRAEFDALTSTESHP